MDSKYYYDMLQRKLYFEILEQIKCGADRFGNNKISKIQGIGMVRLKMLDNRKLCLCNISIFPILSKMSFLKECLFI